MGDPRAAHPAPGCSVPAGGCKAAEFGGAGQVHYLQPHGCRGPRPVQRGSPGRPAPLRPTPLLPRGPGRGSQRPPEAPGHTVSTHLRSPDWSTGGWRPEVRKDSLGGIEIPRGHLGGWQDPSGVCNLAPTGYCKLSEYPVTSMPAMQPYPGPTCTVWSLAAPGMTTCPCLSGTGAGHCRQSECGWEGWEGASDPPAGHSLPTSPLAPCSCLDVDAMQEAAQHLLGTHDFSAFQSAGSPAMSSVRTLRRASVAPDPGSPFILPQENR